MIMFGKRQAGGGGPKEMVAPFLTAILYNKQKEKMEMSIFIQGKEVDNQGSMGI